MSIKALVLDCGGVMCYPKRGHWLLPSDMEDILGAAVPAFAPADVEKAHAASEHWLYEGRLITTERHECELRLGYVTDMNALLKAKLSRAQLEAIARSLTYDDTRSQFYPDAREYMTAWAQKYKLGLLSNAMPSLMRTLVNQGYGKLCDSIIISCLCGFQKPDARMYEASLRELGVKPDETVYVDDLEANLIAARRVGMRAVRMKRDVYEMLAPKPFMSWTGACARDFSELDALIEGGEL